MLRTPTGPVAVHPSDLKWGSPGEPGVPATVVSAGTTGREHLAVLTLDGGGRGEIRSPVGAPVLVPGKHGVVRWEKAILLSGTFDTDRQERVPQ